MNEYELIKKLKEIKYQMLCTCSAKRLRDLNKCKFKLERKLRNARNE